MKRKKLIIIALLLLTLTTGCTKYLSDNDNKRITNEKTGQSLTSNILCKPKDPELLSIYEKYSDNMEVKLEKLQDCEKMKVYDKNNYNGLWVQFFVRPLAWLIIKLGLLVKNYGISVMIIGLLLRLILMPFSAKTMKQSENMKKAQPELERLEKKYKDKTDSDSMMAKSQETMMIYKKYNINPMGGCLVSFIQLPLFFAFLEAINRVPAIFEESLLSLQLGTTPLVGIKSGNYWYLILIALIIITTYLSFKFSMSNTGSSEQQKQMQFMTTFMLIFISIASFSLPTAIALYWVVTNGFSVIQTLILKKRR
ncbi:MAG: YidC/Oxa1 family membrane protein insertase [Bacilli bacterium]|nr:YidC/Oxa1 family membrane protein insertase [Bacilli bacterium]